MTKLGGDQSDIPQWAKQRACDLANEVIAEQKGVGQWTVQCVTPRWDTIYAFARYIASKEEPPVDPLREEAVAIVLAECVTRTDNQVEAIRSGRAGEGKVDLVLTALKRGIELAKSGDA